MPSSRFVVPFVPFALLLSTALAAQQSAAPSDTARLGDLVVTATRSEEPLRRVPASVSVVSGEELRARGIRFVADWLREVPGVTVVPSGSYGGVASVFLRGGESDYTKVLVDGVPVNLPGGAVDLANLSTDNVERIELVRGPASVLYGSDAVAGVLHVITRRGASPGRVHARLLAGNPGTTDLSAGHSGATGAAAWSASLSRFGSSGFYDFNNRYRSTVASGRLGLAPAPGTDLALAVRYGDHSAAFPTDYAGVPSDSNQVNTERGLTLGLEAGRQVSEAVELRVAGSLYRADFGFDDRPDFAADTLGFAFAGTRESRIRRGLVDVRAVWAPTGGVRASLGVELSEESERQVSFSTSNFGDGRFDSRAEFDRSRGNLGVYAQTRAAATPWLDLHLGARTDRNEVFGSFLTWRAGAVALPAGGWRAHVAAGSGFKQPTFSEQFARTPFEVGDPDLSPEHSVSWEAGVERDIGPARVGATWFDQRFTDLVQYTVGAPDAPTYANVARATARGLELSAGWSADPVDLSVQWTALRTRVDEAGAPGVGFMPGERLLRRPAHSLATRAAWRAGPGLRISADLVWTGARDDVDFGSFPAARVRLDPYTLVGLSADLEVARLASGTLHAVARVENALGEEYRTIVGFPGRGRTVLAGLRLGR